MSSTARHRLTLAAAVLGPIVGVAGVAGADIDHRDAVDIARAAVPDGVVVEVQDEAYDLVETTYEVELIIDNGNNIADVEIDRVTGDVTQYNEIPQSPSQRAFWQQILDLNDDAQFDFAQAYRKALKKHPSAAVMDIDLDIDEQSGLLEYDVRLVDAIGVFIIGVDAVDGAVDDVPFRMFPFEDAVDLALIEEPQGTVIRVKLRGGSTPWYQVLVVKSNGRKEITLDIDALSGLILDSSLKIVSGARKQKNKELMQLFEGAALTNGEAIEAARGAVGGGRPLWIKLKAAGGVLYFIVKMELAHMTAKVWIDSVTGDVFQIQ